MTFKNFTDDEEYYQDLKKYMMINHDIYISRVIYDIDDDVIISS